MNRQKIWESTLEILKEKLPDSTFQPWITPLTPLNEDEEGYREGVFVLKSNLAFGVAHLKQKFMKEIQSAFDKVLDTKMPVDIVFVPSEIKKNQKKKPKTKDIPLDNLKQMQSFSALNLKYTFENFVKGDNSKVAYNAALEIAKNPGSKYNPLFISGSVGIGKTHLMQAIGHRILKNFPNLKVKYAKTEEFTNQLVESCRKGKETDYEMKKFRDQYRNVDVLLLDDIQFSEGKKRTEEEIFNTFDALFHAGKQIVFASDRPIESFEKTPDRLKSRYEWGLSVEIKVPDYETRIEIIKNHAKRSNFEITDEVAKFLAKNYSKNVRELEGAYNKVSAYASIQGLELTVESAKNILGYKENKNKITPETIIEACAKYYSTTPELIKSTQRTGDIKLARQSAIYLARKLLDLSFPSIASVFNKNHTTIIYSYDKLKKEIMINKNLSDNIDEIEKIITGF